MIYLLYDYTYDNWKEISFEQFEHHAKNGDRVMAVVAYMHTK